MPPSRHVCIYEILLYIHVSYLLSFLRRCFPTQNTRFKTMSETILTRIDDMGERIAELEKTIAELGAAIPTPAPAPAAAPGS